MAATGLVRIVRSNALEVFHDIETYALASGHFDFDGCRRRRVFAARDSSAEQYADGYLSERGRSSVRIFGDAERSWKTRSADRHSRMVGPE